MNLEETSSVTLETSGQLHCRLLGVEQQIPQHPALCRVCPHVSVLPLCSWFHPLFVKEEQQHFAVVEVVGAVDWA